MYPAWPCCLSCSSDLEEVTSTNDHIDLADLLDQERGEREIPSARAHLGRCEPCRRLRDEVRVLLSDMRADREPDPDESLIRRVVKLLPQRPSLVERLLEAVGRLVPAPAFGALAAEPVRGPYAITALRFDGHGIQVRCQLSRGQGGDRLLGQVVPEDGTALPLLASVVSDGHRPPRRPRRLEVPVSEHGLFVIEPLPPLPFDLLLLDNARSVRLAVEREGSA